MNDLKEEKGTREELRRSQAAPRRSGGGLKRALMVILALVVVLAVVVAAAWKDLSSLDSVRRLFSYNKVTQDEQARWRCTRSATTAATPLRCSATI